VSAKKARDVQSALSRKGFVEYSKRDHRYYFLHYNGKKTSIYTKISHTSSDINSNLISKMARQVRLKSEEFDSLVDCGLDRDGYLTILIKNKILTPPDQRPQA
jgi:predicted RNA binding protein YcfA (HicA-like mRNA interferase family)